MAGAPNPGPAPRPEAPPPPQAGFEPDRYLNGKRIDQNVVPFGLGKRACIGEALARAELYLIIGNFLLRYSISADHDHMPTISSQGRVGIVRKADPYHIVFSR
ncbi:hypothetical protein OESDEN_12619 [Oesophagostomum dentatum]|uniref:Unspecific monooxygenase n=1 Tax=Oesophagostomum dentatum TaxID=61180 RepID=A0A0B1SWR2_OESDE|nr:hypothetical protein OESDEN_12619 [Oesophagostomum dentatum]